jgi:hypothetical protein
MRNLRGATLLAGAATLFVVPLAFGQPTDAEFKCEQAVSKFGAKFVSAKAKCVDKCLKNFWKGLVPESDCLPSYGGATALCIIDNVNGLKGAEDKFRAAILKACDPGTNVTKDCPECYNGGDCSAGGFAGDQVQNIESQVDSFVPGVACERTGASPEDQACQSSTAKALSKQVGSVVKCYDKCKKNEFKGLIAPGSCGPPASDPATSTCVSTANSKAILAADKKCGTIGVIPDCAGGESNDYPSGAAWVNLVDIAISGNIPGTYCE